MPAPENGNLMWRYVAISAVSICMTLLGAWATHSVTQQQLKDALDSQNAVISVRLDSIQRNQAATSDMQVRLEHLAVEIEAIKQQQHDQRRNR